MKKVIACLVSISLFVNTAAPAFSQTPQKVIRAFRTANRPLGKTLRTPTLPSGIQQASALSVGKASLAGTRPVIYRLTPLQTKLHRGIHSAAKKSLVGENLTVPQIQTRLKQGKTQYLAARILHYPAPADRAKLLRDEFTQVALSGAATNGQTAQAAAFWREDLAKSLSVLKQLSKPEIQTLSPAENASAAGNLAARQALQDAASLGIYGTTQDAPLLLSLYYTLAPSAWKPLAETAAARTLLRLGAAKELRELAAKAGSQNKFWQNVQKYAREKGIVFELPSAPKTVQTAVEQTAWQQFGRIHRLAADPAPHATALYLRLNAPAAKPLASASRTAAAAPALILPNVTLADDLAAVSAVQAPALEVTSPVAKVVPPTPQTANTQQALAGEKPAKKGFHFFSRITQKSSNSGVLHREIPLVSQGWGKIKRIFSPSPKAHAYIQAAQAPRQGVLQRASLYLASFVMGLEVATPVITNFGTSFGLSLSDNILVAVATYLPYSVGAFLSNWLKEKIGRKASMNVGLALMGGGFTAGVTLFGLNGHFVPQADALAHFYNILGCITLASTGGVFVHNAVGPIMTDISAGASALSLQKRNANTELSRAAGMAASFAFPFISTKLLGLDWSFTFALPIPLVAAAAVGLNLAKIPNTKPVAAASQAVAEQAKNWISAIKNNGYVRLFKEEPAAAPLLTGLLIMNAVEVSFINGFLFLIPSLTPDPSSQYLFGIAQFAVPFLLGRSLAKNFLKWFPKNNLSLATLLAAAGGLAAIPSFHNAYALTAALFTAEVGISTGFTLAFARTARNIRTQDRIVSLIVASAVSCAVGPILLSNLAQTLMDSGLVSPQTATAAAMLGLPATLTLLSAALFKRAERPQTLRRAAAFAPIQWLKKRFRTR